MSLKMSVSYGLFFLLCFTVFTLAEDDKVLQYTTETFEESIKTNNHFIMFYAPWCGHCKRLHPIWEQLADMVNSDPDSQITIAKVDCTTDHQVCSDQEVTGYPTLKFFKLDNLEGVKFRGTRDLPSLTTFINEQLGTVRGEADASQPEIVEGLVELTESNFESFTSAGSHFIKFYAPWCGHCRKLAPTWESLAKKYEANDDVSIAKLDCTAHRTVCSTHEIKGYPTLLFFRNGVVVEKYSGQRSIEDFEAFVNKMLGIGNNEEPTPTPWIPLDLEADSGQLLAADTFQSGVASGLTFVKFFAPWCGHCKRLAPTWVELNMKVNDWSNVKLARVDCTQANSKEVCIEQEVEGFPTLLLYRNGEKIAEYNGSRNIDDMYDFLAKYFQHDEL